MVPPPAGRLLSAAATALALTLVLLAVSAGSEPSREECRPHIERAQQACEARPDPSEPGLLGWLSDVVFPETRLLRQRNAAIAARERDLVRLKVERGELPAEALTALPLEPAAAAPSLLGRIWSGLFSERRLWQERNAAIAAREEDLRRSKRERGHTHPEPQPASAAAAATAAAAPSLPEVAPELASTVSKQPPPRPAASWAVSAAPQPEVPSSGSWLYDLLFAEANYMKLRNAAIISRERDLVRVKVERGDLPPEALDDPRLSGGAESTSAHESDAGLWNMLFPERRQMVLRRRAIAERHRSLVRAKVERGDLPPEALQELLEQEAEAAAASADSAASGGPLSRLGRLLFPERWMLKLRERAMAERHRDLVRLKVERGELEPEVLRQLDEQLAVPEEQRPAQRSLLGRLWDLLFSEGRFLEIRKKAIAERQADLRRVKEAAARGEAPPPAQAVERPTAAEAAAVAAAAAAAEADSPRNGGATAVSDDINDSDITVEIDTDDDDDDDDDDEDDDDIKDDKTTVYDDGQDDDEDDDDDLDDDRDEADDVEVAAHTDSDSSQTENGPAVDEALVDVEENTVTDAGANDDDNDDENDGDGDGDADNDDDQEQYGDSSEKENELKQNTDGSKNDDQDDDDDDDDNDEDDEDADDNNEQTVAEKKSDNKATADQDDADSTAEKDDTATADHRLADNDGDDDDDDDNNTDDIDDDKSDGTTDQDGDDSTTDDQDGDDTTLDDEDDDDEEADSAVTAQEELQADPVSTSEQPMPSPAPTPAAAATSKPADPATNPATPATRPATPPPTPATPAPRPAAPRAQRPASTIPPLPSVPEVRATAPPPPAAASQTARPRRELEELLGLHVPLSRPLEDAANYALRDLKAVADSAITPLETTYKYNSVSARSLADAEIFAKPVILFLGQLNSGKSTMINYLLGTDATRTTAMPGSGQFRVLTYGDQDERQDGAQVTAHWEFAGLQKFGEAFLERMSGRQLKNRLLEKVNIVDVPGIMEGRQYGRIYPFNDVCQWFIDRADIVFVVFDPHHLDIGAEMESLLDQLKGRENQVRIILNKADQLPASQLLRVQGSLIWSLSPLIGSTTPPPIYSGSFISQPYQPEAPAQLFRSQEDALLRDIADSLSRRVENKIALARRHAVRVRNHARMVDCYVTTFLNQQTFLSNKKKLADDIISNPHKYHIYEGISRVTNISRYDLPDPEVYEDFFTVHPLYDFPTLASTCTYFNGCPLDKLDAAISYQLPELLGKYRKMIERGATRRRG